ncbi:MAG: hypothetical protein C4586_05940 [Anaerolineaceae bacterium]|nr:MAG: hypothetical protein C4586_05940 [Anaerolineaceae bacterium]
MSMTEALKAEIRKHKNRAFRRAFIKRMQTNGVFESDWVEITSDVKKFGKISQSVDTDQYARIAFKSNTVVLNNAEGRFTDENDNRSLWFGYASQQRTLVKIEAGLETPTRGSDGIWRRGEAPGAFWDLSLWDSTDLYDQRSVVFTGIISGDVMLSSQYEVPITVMPLLEVFRTFPASQLNGFTSSGITASQFCEILRDQTDGAGSYVFRPFFNNTTASWNIQTTTSVYADFNTSTSKFLLNENCWDVLQKLAEAEDFIAYISGDGFFYFKDRVSNTTTAAFEFYGLGVPNREFGHTIKKISSFGRKYSKYYSRVSVQFKEDNTTTSYHIEESTLTVSGTNLPWIYGHKTLEITNFLIATSTVAETIAERVFDNVSALKREIEFTTPFIPGLNVLDLVKLNYDPAKALPESLWDLNNWGDTGSASETGALIWDASRGDSFYLNSEEMNLIGIEMDLDKLENKFTARET